MPRLGWHKGDAIVSRTAQRIAREDFQQRYVRAHGAAQLVQAMESGAITKNRAFHLAHKPVARQVTEVNGERNGAEIKHVRNATQYRDKRTITIPWSAKSASRLLVERWPPSLCEELARELLRRLAEAGKLTPPETE